MPTLRTRQPDYLTSGNLYICNELCSTGERCGQTLDNLRRLKAHIDDSHRARKYICHVCLVSLATRASLDTHHLETHGVAMTCTGCQKTRLVHEIHDPVTFICGQCTRAPRRLESRLAEYCRQSTSFGAHTIYDTRLSPDCACRPDQLIHGPGDLVIIGELDENSHQDRGRGYHESRECEILGDPVLQGKTVVFVHLSMDNSLVDDPDSQVAYFRQYVESVEHLLAYPPGRSMGIYLGDAPYDTNGALPAIRLGT